MKHLKSITRKVRVQKDNDGDLVLTVMINGEPATASWNYTAKAFGERNVPRSDYMVTYTINPRGALEVDFIKNVVNKRTQASQAVCFLTENFEDMTVQRTVKIIKKRKK